METIDLLEKEYLKLRLGNLEMYFKREGDEVLYAFRYVESVSDNLKTERIRRMRNIDEFDWTRAIIGPNMTQLDLVMKTPDRPVVVRPRVAMRVPPGRDVSFFIGIPNWLEISAAAGSDRETIVELPVTLLSKTWFGDRESGELCYSMRTKALRTKDEITMAKSFAACPVSIKNASVSILDFQRICLHVEHLTLYSDGVRIWSNGANVIFKGEEEASQIVFSSTSPGCAPDCKRISGPRQTPVPSIVKRSFYFLKYLTGLMYG